jgi:SAM-dependent methyltransferase
MLRTLLMDDRLRRCFIFSNFMPLRYGGGFGRYPGQREFLRKWLAANRTRLAGETRCLDVACGSGEGTYDLALLLLRSGFSADSIHVRGVSVEPLELFSAAHAYFPHNLEREAAYRRHVRPLFKCVAAGNIGFTLEDISMPYPEEEKGYDIILCNGLLGGPFLHDPVDLADTIWRLCERLRAGGILLAADRFHGGWKKLMTDEALRKLFGACGLMIQAVAEGVAGVKGEG